MICPVEIASDMAAMERAMKIQDVMLQAMAKRITWWRRRSRGSATVRCVAGGSATKSTAMAGCWTGGVASLREDGCRWRRWRKYWAVPGEVFRSERAALSREARSGARDRTELHVGEAG